MSNAKHCADMNAEMGDGSVFSVPAQIAAGRLWNRSADLLEFDGVHVSEHVETAVASMLYTMLTGSNCTDFALPHPQTSGPHQEVYEWVQNEGYRIIKQLGSLEAVPAAEANTRPAAVIGSDTADHVAADVHGGGRSIMLTMGWTGWRTFPARQQFVRHRWLYHRLHLEPTGQPGWGG